MLEAIRRTIVVLRQKQILHKLGVVISITVIGIACYVLYHMLRGIDTNEVIEAIKSTESSDVALAGLLFGIGRSALIPKDRKVLEGSESLKTNGES